MQGRLTTKQMSRRATRIMRGIRTGTVAPDSDAIRELAEITDMLSDQPATCGGAVKLVVARLTVVRANGIRMIVEVEADSTFTAFYRYYTQQGARRSTKRFLRNASRNEGLSRIGYYQPGLESVAAQIEKYADPKNPIVKKTIRILKRRMYRQLIGISPDQLGLTRMTSLPIYQTFVIASR